MIKEVTLIGFQSHKKATLELGPGINLISGLSHSGKTALLRGINLVVNNRPLGDGFINDDATSTEVSLIIDEKDIVYGISRGKGKSDTDNYYRITMPDMEDEEFTAFGTEVPEEVAKLINFSDLNIQKQLTPYFLVLDTPSEAAKYIRGIAKLDEIDKVVKELESKRRTAEGEIKTFKTTIEEVSDELRELDKIDLDELEEWIAQLEDVSTEEAVLSVEVEELQRIMDLVQSITPRLELLQTLDFSAIQTDIIKARDVITERRELFAMVQELTHVIEAGEELEQQIVEIPTLTSEFAQLQELGLAQRTIMQHKQDLSALVGQMEDVEEGIYQTDIHLEQAEKEKDKLMAELVECPTCGTFLTSKSKKRLLENSC